jgi:hypothetical protein
MKEDAPCATDMRASFAGMSTCTSSNDELINHGR